jgi:hypothetical protein
LRILGQESKFSLEGNLFFNKKCIFHTPHCISKLLLKWSTKKVNLKTRHANGRSYFSAGSTTLPKLIWICSPGHVKFIQLLTVCPSQIL